MLHDSCRLSFHCVLPTLSSGLKPVRSACFRSPVPLDAAAAATCRSQPWPATTLLWDLLLLLPLLAATWCFRRFLSFVGACRFLCQLLPCVRTSHATRCLLTGLASMPQLLLTAHCVLWCAYLETLWHSARTLINWPRGVTVSTLDSESSDRGSNPREASCFGWCGFFTLGWLARAGSNARLSELIRVLQTVASTTDMHISQFRNLPNSKPPPLGNIKEIQQKCRDPGSNRGPSDLQSDALPTELSRPVASGSGSWSQL